MKFRNPKKGEIYTVTHNGCYESGFCGYTLCSECNIAKSKGLVKCSEWVNNNPEEAARLMGYEVVYDEPKADSGKPRPSLVPPALIRGVDAIREYGEIKYKDPENWRNVEAQRYWEAALRHALAAWNDWKAVDEESGMPHIWHMACNLAFLMQYMEESKNVNS